MEALRCHVHDLGPALPFYRALGFRRVDGLGQTLAVVRRAHLVLWLCAPAPPLPEPRRRQRLASSGSHLVLEVAALDTLLIRLQALGGRFPALPTQGAGGREVRVADPSGNVVELFEPWPEAPPRCARAGLAEAERN